MPHLVLYYTPQLDSEISMSAVCRDLADTMMRQQDEEGRQVFPTGGLRVLAYPAAHYAVADGSGDFAFVYANLRMGKGRSAEAHRNIGEALLGVLKARFEPLQQKRIVGLTLQIDESPGQVFDGKSSNLHPLFSR